MLLFGMTTSSLERQLHKIVTSCSSNPNILAVSIDCSL